MATDSAISWHPVPEDLNEILLRIWIGLEQAAADPARPWNLTQLGTVSSRGPELRTVVLRAVSRPERMLEAYSDVRAAKIGQIRNNPHVQWLFYDWQQRVQLTVRGTAAIHSGDDIAEAAWSQAPRTSRRAYLAPFAPGTPSVSPSRNLPPGMEGHIPEEAELTPGQRVFAVIRSRVTELDILFIERAGSQRARFVWSGTDWHGTWIHP